MKISQHAGACLLVTIGSTVLFIPPPTALAKSWPITVQSTHASGVRRVIKKEGWKIPGLAQSRIAGYRRAFAAHGEAPVQIYVTAFKPIREIVVNTSLYSFPEDGETLVIRQLPISIRSIVRYEVGGKAFCYSIQGVEALYNKRTDTGGYGGEYGFLYYDNDGDGKFESFEIGGHILPFTPKVPTWVLH